MSNNTFLNAGGDPWKKWIKFMIHVVLPTAVGAWIYVALRSTDLLVFDWLDAAGMTGWIARSDLELPGWLLYSLPDGCWVYAFTSWMLLIWGRFTPWVFAGLAMALAGEFGQLAGLVAGTYDNVDVLFYVLGFLLAGAICAQSHLLDICRFGNGRFSIR